MMQTTMEKKMATTVIVDEMPSWVVLPIQEMVYLGSDPEYADMDNPRGERYGIKWSLLADGDRGYRRGFGTLFDTEEEAEMFIRTLDEDGRSPNCADWFDARPCYGSEAWDETGQDAIDVAEERRDFDR